jgi:hypothetical protein
MAELRHFQRDELLITQEQAERIIRYFFGELTIPPGQLTDDDVCFAQALLLEGIDESNWIGYVEDLFKIGSKPSVDYSFIKDIAKAFAKRAARDWFDHATGKDMENPSIYNSVRSEIARNWRAIWGMREQGLGLTYYNSSALTSARSFKTSAIAARMPASGIAGLGCQAEPCKSIHYRYTMTKHIAVYIRVSSKSQDTAVQEDDLKRWANAQSEPVK